MAAFTQNRVTLTGSGEPQELATLVVIGEHPRRARRRADARPRLCASGEDREGAAAHDDPVARGVAAAVRRRHQRRSDSSSRSTASPSRSSASCRAASRSSACPRMPTCRFATAAAGAVSRPEPDRHRPPESRASRAIRRRRKWKASSRRLRSEQPDFNTGWTINLVPLREQLVGDVRLAVLVLFGAVGAVLLIACGNIGSLMLTRASGRRRELAIRSAIGAGTGRLLTQLICESLMLSIAGGVLGVVLAIVDPERPDDLGRIAAADPAALAGHDRSERDGLCRDRHGADDARLRPRAGDRRHRRIARRRRCATARRACRDRGAAGSCGSRS